MRLNADGTTLHKQVLMVLRDEISRGSYARGTALPSEEACGRRFGVSRVTVRRALAELEALGYVERRHGRGTFVRGDAPQQPRTLDLSLIDSLHQLARSTEVKIVEVGMASPPEAIAQSLGTAPDQKAVHIVRIRQAGGVALLLLDTWLPEAIGRRISEATLKRKAMYQILLDRGIRFGRILQEFSAEAADPWQAQALQVAVGTPLIRVTRIVYDANDEPIQYLTSHASPDRSRFVMDVSGEGIETLKVGSFLHHRAGG